MNPELARVRRLRMKQRYVRAVRFVRFLWGIAGLLFLVLLAEVVVVVLRSPRCWIYRIEAEPGDTLTAVELIRLADIPPGTNYHSVSLGQVARRIAAHEPRVRRAFVRKGALGVLRIGVEERTAVCRIGLAAPARYLDANGVLFTRPTAPATPVPVVEGLPRQLPVRAFGQRLGGDPRIANVLDCLRHMDMVFTDYHPLDVDRVMLAPNGRMTLTLRQGTRVLLGEPTDFHEKFYAVRQDIIDASQRGFALHQVDYIDARAPHRAAGLGAEYKLREGAEGAQP